MSSMVMQNRLFQRGGPLDPGQKWFAKLRLLKHFWGLQFIFSFQISDFLLKSIFSDLKNALDAK